SRALEVQRKAPLLGLDIALRPKGAGPEMSFDPAVHAKLLAQWTSLRTQTGRISVKLHPGPEVNISARKTAQIAHGTFDNDCDVINASLARIRGGKVKVKVTD